MSETPPIVPYWHLWVDADGVSHQRRCEMRQFESKSIQPPAAAQWQGLPTTARMTTMITVLPVDWVGAWHENPKPQWIIPLSGGWFVEAMDGSRVVFGVGELSFGADQNCREHAGKRGHRSGTVGEVPAVLMIVQLEDQQVPLPACEWR